jgi:hypothetical protein
MGSAIFKFNICRTSDSRPQPSKPEPHCVTAPVPQHCSIRIYSTVHINCRFLKDTFSIQVLANEQYIHCNDIANRMFELFRIVSPRLENPKPKFYSNQTYVWSPFKN